MTRPQAHSVAMPDPALLQAVLNSSAAPMYTAWITQLGLTPPAPPPKRRRQRHGGGSDSYSSSSSSSSSSESEEEVQSKHSSDSSSDEEDGSYGEMRLLVIERHRVCAMALDPARGFELRDSRALLKLTHIEVPRPGRVDLTFQGGATPGAGGALAERKALT